VKHVPRLLLSIAAAASLAAGTLAVTGSPGSAAADAQSVAASHLKGDASGALTYRSSGGVYDFVGVPAGVTLNDPGVSSSTSVADAAAAHLARYGAAFGSKQAGTTLTELRSASTVTGDVVRYQQNVGGLPVMGGEFVVSLRQNRELDSILAKTSRTTKVAAAKVSEGAARAAASRAFTKQAGKGGDATVTSMGRWVVDPALIGAPSALGVKTAYRYEIRRGPQEWRMLLVDDQTGFVLMNNDLINEAKNRVVCDNANTLRNPNLPDPYPCTNATPPDRIEGGPVSGIPDVNAAFDLGGVVYDNYLAFGGVDLTNLIGRDIGGGTLALAQTVRLCFTGFTCPYANAFWNGVQMYYGQGYAGADDVVGHEMTHGVTERTSGLFYWGQSGAMNESISDIMGEIIDHRNVTGADVPATAWALGEDLPCCPAGIRNVQDPTLFNDPDRTGSPFYVKEPCCGYPDNDGVHTNSGVGNHTFYLASQGGTFNGQTITGIDSGDATLNRSAKLWLLTDQLLSSGSDYADEAVVLEQACAALQGAGVTSAANCTTVYQATLATELRNTPVNNPQPADATVSCAAGTPRTLFDSESGTPTSKFTAGTGWSRNGIPGWGQNAHTNPAAWSNDEAALSTASSLTATSPIALPAGQASYLFFQHWRFLEYDSGGFYDAGTVEVNGFATAALPWVNGPSETIFTGFANPKSGQKGFGGDSRGYIASRLDLSLFAGQNVTPQFTMNTDNSFSYIGWYVDDIQVYTCDNVLVGKAKLKGKPIVGHKLRAKAKGWGPPGVTFTYQWMRNGKAIKHATKKKYKLKGKDKGKKISCVITGHYGADAKSKSTKKVKVKPRPHHH
jgi:bacillolysin